MTGHPDPAPPYVGEGPFALWHVSEDPALSRFVPRAGRVWAIDTRHLPLYWFPRECPRATFLATGRTGDDDVERFLSGDRARRVHVIAPEWLARMREASVYAYRLPQEPFDVVEGGRFYIAPQVVDALERIELGDLLQRNADAQIELRIAPGLLELWDEVVASTLDFSGIRLRNLAAA